MDRKAIKGALLRYRIMAYIVGVLLVILICIGMPLKYLSADQFLNLIGSRINMVIGICHGWLYLLLLASAVDLGRRVKWSWKWLLAIALAGTVPFLSFVAERKATGDVRRRVLAKNTGAAPEH